MRRAAAHALVLSALLLSLPQSALARTPAHTLGVYVGANNSSGVSAYESWIGHPVDRVLDYLADQDWTKINNPSWWIEGWAQTRYRDRLVYSVPMLPASGASLQAGARGDYDEHFRQLAQRLVAAGQGGVVIRPGWEFNGGWYRWSAASDPAAFRAYFRRIVTAMRSVQGGAFKFDWCPSLGQNSIPAADAYPGDAYVDYIGLDVYDQYLGPEL